jgi:hypothetical protein
MTTNAVGSNAATYTVVSVGITSRAISSQGKPGIPSRWETATQSARHSRIAPTAKTSLVKNIACGFGTHFEDFSEGFRADCGGWWLRR